MVRQRIKRVQPVFTYYNDSNISPVVKQNTIVQNDNKKLNSTNKQSYYNNKYTNNNSGTTKLGQIDSKYIKKNNKQKRTFIKYNFNRPNLEVHYEVPCEPKEVKRVAIKGEHEMIKYVYDIETSI